jgi:hypothetical protein
MRKFFLTASVLALTVTTFATSASAKEAIKVNSASCNYAPAIVKTDKDGRQNYNIVCIIESKTGYKKISYGVGKDQTIKIVAAGKNQLVYNQKIKALQDGKKVVFVYQGTNLRSAVVPSKTVDSVFTTNIPTLAQFNMYFDKYAICAQ